MGGELQLNTENAKVPQSVSVEPERGYPRGKMAEAEACARVRGRCRQELQSILTTIFHCSMFMYKAVLVISTFFDVDVDVCC